MRQSSWLQPKAVFVRAGLQSAAFPVIPRRAGIHTGQGPGGCLYDFRALDGVGAPVSLSPGRVWAVESLYPHWFSCICVFPAKAVQVQMQSRLFIVFVYAVSSDLLSSSVGEYLVLGI